MEKPSESFPAQLHPGDPEEVVGTLKSFNKGTSYGFISSPQVPGDIFLQGSQLPDDTPLEPGRPLRFTLSRDAKGRPQARAVTWLAPPPGPLPMPATEKVVHVRYTGHLKSMGDNYGFIECAETFRAYGVDVYLKRCQLKHDWQTQQVISFEVAMDGQGRPQAKNVQCDEVTLPSSTCVDCFQLSAAANQSEPDAVTSLDTTCSNSADGSSSDEALPVRQAKNASRW